MVEIDTYHIVKMPKEIYIPLLSSLANLPTSRDEGHRQENSSRTVGDRHQEFVGRSITF